MKFFNPLYPHHLLVIVVYVVLLMGFFYIDPSISENSVGGYEQEKKQLMDLVSIVMNPVKNKVCLD